MNQSRLFVAVLPSLLMLCLGCASIHRTEYMERRASEHVILRPIEQVWPEVEGLLRDRGWSVDVTQDFGLTTAWHKAPGGQGLLPGGRSEKIPVERLVVVGTPLPNGRCTVQIFRQERMWQQIEYGAAPPSAPANTYGPPRFATDVEKDVYHVSNEEIGPDSLITSHRDLQLEWALLERVEPGWTAAHEQVASNKYR